MLDICTVLHKFNTVIVHVEIITYTTRHFSNSWGTFALLQGFVLPTYYLRGVKAFADVVASTSWDDIVPVQYPSQETMYII